MEKALESLLDSLLYEGYALYPYTPGATKNATPTPFGIVYPPGYAEGNAATFDHLRMDCLVEDGPEAALEATICFLQSEGERHRGIARRLRIPSTPLADLIEGGRGEDFSFTGEEIIAGRVRMRADRVGESLARVRVCVHNSSDPGADARSATRGDALRFSLISTHVVAEVTDGRFVSPLDTKGPHAEALAECESVNTWPVLANPTDTAMLGAAIVLPDHPSMAPESLGNLFDSTEIEEALLLHVHALSNEEREEIERQDPAVREMVERAAATTPDQIMNLHGRLSDVEPEPGHPNPGEASIEVGGTTFVKGGKVVLRPRTDRDVLDKLLAGKVATIERIYYDYDDRAHIGVTVDDDAAQPLFRETGRYLFFSSDEVEAVDSSNA
ncbi:MAG: hypothetical protein ACR2G3_02905 [Solirubrobacterales bacterium]